MNSSDHTKPIVVAVDGSDSAPSPLGGRGRGARGGGCGLCTPACQLPTPGYCRPSLTR
jgi:hypothetical protein